MSTYCDVKTGEGLFDVASKVVSEIASKVTGKVAQVVATKAVTKAAEKGAERFVKKHVSLLVFSPTLSSGKRNEQQLQNTPSVGNE